MLLSWNVSGPFYKGGESKNILRSQDIAIKILLKKAYDELHIHKVYSDVFYKYLDEAVDENGNYEDVVRFSIVNNN